MLNQKDFPPLPSQKRLQDGKETTVRHTENIARRNSGCAASINDLPDEILDEILAYLPSLDESNFQLLSLVSLSLTNRRLHKIVVDKLYASFDSFFCSPYPFLRTVVSDQQLAAKVRSMTFKYGDGVHSERTPYQSSAADKKTIKEGLKLLAIPEWKTWASDCNDPKAEQEILYTAILMHTPNIVSLDIDHSCVPYKVPKWLDLIRWTVNGGNVGRIHQFNHLKSIRIDVGFLKLRHLAPLFKMRCLRSLNMVTLMEANVAKEGKAAYLKRLLPPASSTIEELYLQASYIDSSLLCLLIRCIKRLRIFEYSHRDVKWEISGVESERYWLGDKVIWDHYEHAPPPIDLVYSTIISALERHRRCLESVALIDSLEGSDLHNQSIGSLRDFDRLWFLAVPMSAFFDPSHVQDTFVERLPPSLQRLQLGLALSMGRYDCMPTLKHMAVCCRDFLPLLKEIELSTDYFRPKDLILHSKDILKPLSDQGVDVVIGGRVQLPPVVPNVQLSADDREDIDDVNVHVRTFDVSDSDESDEESLYSI